MINYMRQKFDVNAAFFIYANLEQKNKFDMALYSQTSAAFSFFIAICYNV